MNAKKGKLLSLLKAERAAVERIFAAVIRIEIKIFG